MLEKQFKLNKFYISSWKENISNNFGWIKTGNLFTIYYSLNTNVTYSNVTFYSNIGN